MQVCACIWRGGLAQPMVCQCAVLLREMCSCLQVVVELWARGGHVTVRACCVGSGGVVCGTCVAVLRMVVRVVVCVDAASCGALRVVVSCDEHVQSMLWLMGLVAGSGGEHDSKGRVAVALVLLLLSRRPRSLAHYFIAVLRLSLVVTYVFGMAGGHGGRRRRGVAVAQTEEE